ncbi:MAG TPA: phosphate signaling complex protein PhoU [Pirellulales bacterium]
MSKNVHNSIRDLKQHVVALGQAVEEATAKAIRVVETRDSALAKEVIAGDAKIDAMEVQVEEMCLKVLALCQPAARDLRFVVGVLKINNDLERIGDLAKNIAKRMLYLVERSINTPVDFRPIAAATQAMVKQAIDALVDNDASLARKVRQRDLEVDALYDQIHEEVMAEIRARPADIDATLKVFAVARHFERLGDMAAKIAEEVIYVVEADVVRHQVEV